MTSAQTDALRQFVKDIQDITERLEFPFGLGYDGNVAKDLRAALDTLKATPLSEGASPQKSEESIEIALVRIEAWLDRNANHIDWMPHGRALSEISMIVPPLQMLMRVTKALRAIPLHRKVQLMAEGFSLDLAYANRAAPLTAETETPNAELLRLLDGVTRLEVIGPKGREWTRWNISLEPQLQDRGLTLKLFYSPKSQLETPQEPRNDEVNAAIDALASKAKRLHRGTTGHDYGACADVDRQANLLKSVLAAPLTAETPERECVQDCQACSGEVCMKHDGPCDCDTAERHEDSHGTMFVGADQGMVAAPLTAETETPNAETYEHALDELIDSIHCGGCDSFQYDRCRKCVKLIVQEALRRSK